MKTIEVTVTSKKNGTALTYPYERHMKSADETPIYEVPTYEVKIGGNHRTFKVVRFGLTPQSPPWMKTRRCNTGLSAYHKVTPTWLHYDTHSFGARGVRGAWRILEGKQFLLHEGATPPDGIGASLGCLEVVDFREWNRFLHTLEGAAATSCHQIGASKAFILVIEAAHFPIAHLKSIQKI
jgi:hypothetical protein